jgi:hypothetical protein
MQARARHNPLANGAIPRSSHALVRRRRYAILKSIQRHAAP